jgi:hypothetical protein
MLSSSQGHKQNVFTSSGSIKRADYDETRWGTPLSNSIDNILIKDE